MKFYVHLVLHLYQLDVSRYQVYISRVGQINFDILLFPYVEHHEHRRVVLVPVVFQNQVFLLFFRCQLDEFVSQQVDYLLNRNPLKIIFFKLNSLPKNTKSN